MSENRTIVVIINGNKYGFEPNVTISYRDIADIAGFKSPLQPSMTVKPKNGEGRIMQPGASVYPSDGLVFNVADMSNA